jgi:hypothetical protein
MKYSEEISNYIKEMEKLKQIEKEFREKITNKRNEERNKLKALGINWFDIENIIKEIKKDNEKAKRKEKWKKSISESLSNKRYINFDNKYQKYIPKEELYLFLEQGWKLGKIKKERNAE